MSASAGESSLYAVLPTNDRAVALQGDEDFVDTSVPLKISLCWYDKEGSPSSAVQLVNDLDLTVTDPLASRFDRTSTAEDVLDGVDLRGQRFLVTGGYAGLGVATLHDVLRLDGAWGIGGGDLELMVSVDPRLTPYL